MVSVSALLVTSFGGVITWILLAAYFMTAMQLPRLLFIAGHYTVSIFSPVIIFAIIYRWLPHFSPFWTMITAMGSMFIVEIIVFNFLYKGDLWFLNFTDWIVPVFLLASSIYLIGVILS